MNTNNNTTVLYDTPYIYVNKDKVIDQRFIIRITAEELMMMCDSSDTEYNAVRDLSYPSDFELRCIVSDGVIYCLAYDAGPLVNKSDAAFNQLANKYKSCEGEAYYVGFNITVSSDSSYGNWSLSNEEYPEASVRRFNFVALTEMRHIFESATRLNSAILNYWGELKNIIVEKHKALCENEFIEPESFYTKQGIRLYGATAQYSRDYDEYFVSESLRYIRNHTADTAEVKADSVKETPKEDKSVVTYVTPAPPKNEVSTQAHVKEGSIILPDGTSINIPKPSTGGNVYVIIINQQKS